LSDKIEKALNRFLDRRNNEIKNVSAQNTSEALLDKPLAADRLVWIGKKLVSIMETHVPLSNNNRFN